MTRNKVKRAVREAFWELAELIQPGHDYVIVARPGVEGLLEREGQDGIRTSLAELLETTRPRSVCRETAARRRC